MIYIEFIELNIIYMDYVYVKRLDRHLFIFPQSKCVLNIDLSVK